ncbi:MAG: flagellar basal body-associated protein FliL [Burkholderiales bacterium]|nr:flagellar basal body-associated protein FliL [Burkholderiales bacterium]
MSKKAAATPAPETAPAKSKRTPLLLVALASAALAGGAGAAGAWLWQKPAPSGEAAPQAKAREKPVNAKAERKAPPQFVNLDLFTVNLHEEGGERYLQVGIVLQAVDQTAVDEVKQHMPVIRSRLLLLLSSKSADELLTVDGKQKLSSEILDQVRGPLAAKAPGKGLEGVLFSSFVIQ